MRKEKDREMSESRRHWGGQDELPVETGITFQAVPGGYRAADPIQGKRGSELDGYL